MVPMGMESFDDGTVHQILACLRCLQVGAKAPDIHKLEILAAKQPR